MMMMLLLLGMYDLEVVSTHPKANNPTARDLASLRMAKQSSALRDVLVFSVIRETAFRLKLEI